VPEARSPRAPDSRPQQQASSSRSLRDEAFKAEVSKVHKDNYSVLGARKMHVMLNRLEAVERYGAVAWRCAPLSGS